MLERAFHVFSSSISRWAGSPAGFLLAFVSVLVWAAFGPLTHYSDAWMLAINTGTTIVTFLMVFVIQSSQNRDTTALQIKIDELIRATQGASNALIDLEDLTPSEILQRRAEYLRVAARARELGLDFDIGSPSLAECGDTSVQNNSPGSAMT
jgi:low affinity Fe/Cu permease